MFLVSIPFHLSAIFLTRSIALWSVMKKKPLSVTRNAHPGPAGTAEGSVRSKENWISCVAALQGTDLVASG